VFAALALIALLGEGAFCSRASSQGLALDRGITVAADGRITAAVDRMTAHLVTLEIQRVSGAVVHGELAEPTRMVSVRFDGLDFVTGLGRLLPGESFAVSFAEGGAVRRIRFVGSAATAAPAGIGIVAARPQASEAGAASGPISADELRLMLDQRTVALGEDLAAAMGADSASVADLLFGVGLDGQGLRLRQQAVQRGIAAMEHDDTLRTAVVGRLGAMSNHEVGLLVSDIAGDRAPEFARMVLGSSRDVELRARISAVLPTLRH
jgi:hypothetical protein